MRALLILFICFSTSVFASDLYLGEITPKSASVLIVSLKMSQEPVTIVIDSPGGDTDVAWAIVSTIQKHGQVTCWVRGRAMSAAFTVLQSCKTRTMTKESVLMMHAPYFEVSNAKLDMQSLAGMLSELQTSTERIAEFCATRMNLPSQMVYERLLSGNWYIGSRTALAMGAIDSVE